MLPNTSQGLEVEQKVGMGVNQGAFSKRSPVYP